MKNNNAFPKQASVEFFLSFIRKRRTIKAQIVINTVTTIVGTKANKNLPKITLAGDAFHVEIASSCVPKYNMRNGIAVPKIAGNATNNRPQ